MLKAILVGVAGLIAMVLLESYLVERPTCFAHWEDSGLRVRWSFWGDCQVETASGKWIPAKKFREEHPEAMKQPGVTRGL